MKAAQVDDYRTRLLARRIALGLTQRDLADRMGTSQSAVCELETGKGTPRLSTLSRWAEALGLRLSVRIEGRT